MTKFLSLFAILIAAPNLLACSFCGPDSNKRATLREQFIAADAVVFGTLKNPQLGSDPTTGTTEFHATMVLKSHATVAGKGVITIPRYIPVPAGETGEAVVFFADRKGLPDAVRIQTSTAAVAAYLKGAAKLDPTNVTARLEFVFQHLDATDETVASDAFLEFAKANDADILAAKAKFDPAKLRALVKNPKTKASQLGVFALLLGLCGDKTDAALLAGMVAGRLNERTMTALGGILSGLVLLEPEAGWKATGEFLSGSQYNFGVRLNAFSAVRYLQATHPKECRAPILTIYRELLDDTDSADLAIEDLRRWKWWDHTEAIIKLHGQPGFEAKGKRNAILRYALSCPEPVAKAFVETMRKQDAEWVKGIEERMKDLE